VKVADVLSASVTTRPELEKLVNPYVGSVAGELPPWSWYSDSEGLQQAPKLAFHSAWPNAEYGHSLVFHQFEESELFSFSHLPHPERIYDQIYGFDTNLLAPGGPPVVSTSPHTQEPLKFDREVLSFLCTSAHSMLLGQLS
jgi:hypothetical protein